MKPEEFACFYLIDSYVDFLNVWSALFPATQSVYQFWFFCLKLTNSGVALL